MNVLYVHLPTTINCSYFEKSDLGCMSLSCVTHPFPTNMSERMNSFRTWAICASFVFYHLHSFVILPVFAQARFKSHMKWLICAIWFFCKFSHVKLVPCAEVCFCSPLFLFHLADVITLVPPSPAPLPPSSLHSSSLLIPTPPHQARAVTAAFAGMLAPFRAPPSTLHALTNMSLNTQPMIDELTARLWARK